MPLDGLDALPKPHRLPGVIASLCHHHQSNVVGLGLLLAAHGQVIQQLLQVESADEAPQPEQRQPRQGAREEEQAPCREIAHPRGRETLGDVRRSGVRDLVAENRRQSVFAPAHVHEAAVDKELSTREDKGVCRF